MYEQGSPRNAATRHLAATAGGLDLLYAFGLADESSILREVVALPRIGAAAASVALVRRV